MNINTLSLSMKIMISQPTFFPWLGYFDMISQVDHFVILDDVDFNYQSWQHRNNFRTAKGLEIFTVSVKDGKKKKKINEIKIENSEFTIKKLIKFLSSNYGRSKYFKVIFKDFSQALSKMSYNNNLIFINIDIIKWCLNYLEIKTPITFSSEININSLKTDRIIDICKFYSANEYLSTPGAKVYLEEEKDKFKKTI